MVAVVDSVKVKEVDAGSLGIAVPLERSSAWVRQAGPSYRLHVSGAPSALNVVFVEPLKQKVWAEASFQEGYSRFP